MPRSTASRSIACRADEAAATHGDVKVGVGAEQPVRAERPPGGVGDRPPPPSRQAQRRGREVVGRVVDDRAAADARELLAHPRYLGDHPRARLDVGVELAGEDAREVEGGRAEVEDAAAERGAVDQLADHLDHRARGPAREAVDPEQPLEVGVLAQRDRARRAAALARARASNHSPLLISTTQPATTSPIVGSPSPSGASATLVQAASKPGERGPRAVDRVDDQHELRLAAAGRDHARGPRSRTPSAARWRRPSRRGTPPPRRRSRTSRRRPRSRARARDRRRRRGAGARSRAARARDRTRRCSPGRARASPTAAAAPSVSSTLRFSPSRHTSRVTFWPGSNSWTASERSSASWIGRSSMRVMMSPPSENARSWKRTVALAALQPGLLARPVGLDDLEPRAPLDREVEALARAAGTAARTDTPR